MANHRQQGSGQSKSAPAAENNDTRNKKAQIMYHVLVKNEGKQKRRQGGNDNTKHAAKSAQNILLGSLPEKEPSRTTRQGKGKARQGKAGQRQAKRHGVTEPSSPPAGKKTPPTPPLTRSLEHNLRREVGALHLKHTLGEHEVLPPEGNNVGLKAAPRGAKVEQARNASVDLERRHHEHAADHHVVHGCASVRVRLVRHVAATAAAGGGG